MRGHALTYINRRRRSVPGRGEFGRGRVASAGGLLDAEIVSADKGLIVVMPGGAVVEGQHAGKRHREHRTLHVTLLRIEIFRKLGAGIVDVINAPHAGKVVDRIERGLRRHQMVGVIVAD